MRERHWRWARRVVGVQTCSKTDTKIFSNDLARPKLYGTACVSVSTLKSFLNDSYQRRREEAGRKSTLTSDFVHWNSFQTLIVLSLPTYLCHHSDGSADNTCLGLRATHTYGSTWTNRHSLKNIILMSIAEKIGTGLHDSLHIKILKMEFKSMGR